MAKDKDQIEKDVHDLMDVFEEIAKHNKEGYTELVREVNEKSANWMIKMNKRTKLGEVSTNSYDDGADLAIKISEQFIKKGALKKIMEEALVGMINKQAPEMIEHIKSEIGTDTSPENLDRIAANLAGKTQSENSSYPIAQNDSLPNIENSKFLSEESAFPTAQTPSGLPKSDPTPAPEKVKKVKEKKKTNWGDKLKKMGRAALRMNPLLGGYMDSLDEEESRAKSKEREEKMHEKMLAAGMDPSKPGMKGASDEVVKLLKKIEENTRTGGSGTGSKDGDETSSTKGSSRKKLKWSMMGQMIKGGVRNTLNSTDAGSAAVKAYDIGKTVLLGAKDLGGEALSKLHVKDKMNSIGSFAKKMAKPVGQYANKMVGRADRAIQDGPMGQKYLDMQWKAKEGMRTVGNKIGGGLESAKEKFSNLNPFKEGAVSKFKESITKNPTVNLLTKIATNTKETAVGFGKGIMGFLKPLFSMLMQSLGRLLLPLLPVLLKVAAIMAGVYALFKGAEWLIEKLFGKTGDLKTDQDARESTKEGSTLDKINKAAGGQGLKPDADKSDVEKIQTERPTAANKKRWETRIFDQGTMVTTEEARALKEKHGIDVPESSIKTNAIAKTETNKSSDTKSIETNTTSDTKSVATNTTSDTKSVATNKSSDIQSTVEKAAGVSKINPAPPKLTHIPENVEQGAAVGAQLDQKIEHQGQAKAMAPIISNNVTNVNNNSTSTSIRIHPRNQESTWNRYNEGRYAA